jgi:DNA-binding MarR family transcriptional regulator
MKNLNEVIFYILEKASKAYRQFAQKRISDAGFDITIDQWLVLKTIQENPEYLQQQIAETVFKDYASVTRIIELLVKKEFLSRRMHVNDRRRFELTITKKGEKILKAVAPIIAENRKQALTGLSKKDIETLRQYSKEITANCSK